MQFGCRFFQWPIPPAFEITAITVSIILYFECDFWMSTNVMSIMGDISFYYCLLCCNVLCVVSVMSRTFRANLAVTVELISQSVAATSWTAVVSFYNIMSNLAGFQMKLYFQIAYVVVFFDRRDVKSFASKVLMVLAVWVVSNGSAMDWQPWNAKIYLRECANCKHDAQIIRAVGNIIKITTTSLGPIS